VSQSDDDGQSWSSLHAIDNNWNTRANWLQLRASDSARLHLLWMVDQGNGTSPTLVHSTSTDGGVHWQRNHQASQKPLRAVASAATANGFAFVTWNNEDHELALVELRNHEGIATTPLPWQGNLPQSATTLGDPSGPLFLSWGELVENAYPLFPAMGVPATRYTWLLPCAK
jgi:hypothetical protein